MENDTDFYYILCIFSMLQVKTKFDLKKAWSVSLGCGKYFV